MICSKFITFAVTKTTSTFKNRRSTSCDLLKIHYLCGDKDNNALNLAYTNTVVICSKFITFAVTKTTFVSSDKAENTLWFAQNSLPLRWQRQRVSLSCNWYCCCDLLKIHYLCGDKDNLPDHSCLRRHVVICSKFITFAVTKTTPIWWYIVSDGCDLLKIHYLCGDKDNYMLK